MPVKNRISRCFIHLVDFKNSKEWYKKMFNFKVASESNSHIVFKMDEGPSLTLLQAQVDHITPLPYSVFFFETDDVEKTFQEFKNKGAKVDDIEPFGVDMRGCHVYDPEGNMILACTLGEE
ncbi:VOC family protein [Filobacillus milosensis]|uniref:VOC family protein n=1 Tax=Filobacillus milosensis TaxID=94137 RepID=A0A4Y8IK69_9BACI|nr:VOC family protein [Filobacillus milosensis]TFB21356.1 VOC family protein [Filobacillus milosensis]